MRITNSMMTDNMLRNLNNGLKRVSTYHNQLASNRRIVKLSDDPIGVLNSMGARQQIRRLEQYQKNVDASRALVTQTESAVTEMEQRIVDIKELLTDAMGTENNDDKKIFAAQIRQMTDSLLELCNSTSGDKYLFGGFNTTRQPFTAERDATGKLISVKYNGLDLTGKNVTFGGTSGGNPPRFEAEGFGISELEWTGQIDVPGEYTVATTEELEGDQGPATIVLEDGTTHPALAFTDTSTGKVVKAYLADFPDEKKFATGQIKPGDKVTVELKTANGESFGKVSWVYQPEVDEDGNKISADVTEDDILNALETGMSGGKTVGTSSVKNNQILPGPEAPAGLTWTGTLQDTKQKYTMETEGSVITFRNSFGSQVASIDLSKLENGTDIVYEDDVNGNYSFKVNLKDPVSGMDFGTVSYRPHGSDVIEFPAGVTYPEQKIAYMIGQAGTVTTVLGEEATQRIQYEIGFNMDIDVTFTGIDLVGTGDDNMFNVLINLADDLDSGMRNEDLTHYLTVLSEQQDRLLTNVMKCGNRTTKLETMVNRYRFDAINYEETRSNIEDIDQAKVITQMKYAEMIYKQALASGAQIIQPTLMDFLH